jgi:hypothetical protein
MAARSTDIVFHSENGLHRPSELHASLRERALRDQPRGRPLLTEQQRLKDE